MREPAAPATTAKFSSLAENFIALNMRRSMDATYSTSEGSHRPRTVRGAQGSYPLAPALRAAGEGVLLCAEGVAQNGPEVGASICHGTTVAERPRMARLCGTTPSRRDSSAAAVPRLRRWPLCRYLRDTLREKRHRCSRTRLCDCREASQGCLG